MILVLLGLFGGAYTSVYLLSRHGGRGAVVRIPLEGTPSPEHIARVLYEHDVVDRPWLFALALRFTGAASHGFTGVVILRDDLTPRAVLRALANGHGVVRVLVPEGVTRFDIARRLEAAGLVDHESFLHATTDRALLATLGLHANDAEGYLFPDTYDLPAGAHAEDLLARLVRTGRRKLDELHAQHAASFARALSAGFDERAIVTLASIVQSESGPSDDPTHIASVFWNRLTRPDFVPRLLQSDPTVLYGCRAARSPSCTNVPPTGRVTITRSMLDDDANPYNTYRHEGLPPGPIGNPGIRALEAALEPADTRDLYFVATGDGRSAFAATRAEHEANVRRYVHPGR